MNKYEFRQYLKYNGMYVNEDHFRNSYKYYKNNSSLVPFNNQTSRDEVEESTMNTSIQAVATQKPYSVESDRVEHFVKVRLPRIAYDKMEELSTHFNIKDDPYPKTMKELLERIEKKHYVINKEREAIQEEFSYGCPLDSVRFRDPEKKEDQKGYTDAVKMMHAGMRDAEDEIVAHQNDGEKILVALAKFEGKTFH